MKILPKPLEFEWDEGNINKNWIKHSVTNKEAEECFSNTPRFIISDNEHSKTEERYQLLSKTNSSKI